jgi:hypothetical protein
VHITTPSNLYGSQRRFNHAGQLLTEVSVFEDPKPKAAPSDVLAPEEALRRLNRPPNVEPHDRVCFASRHCSVAIDYLAVLGWLEVPHRPPATGAKLELGTWGILGDDAFFNSTAPQGKWVWWVVVQRHRAQDGEYEYLYMDAVIGQAMRACFVAQDREAIAQACPPES